MNVFVFNDLVLDTDRHEVRMHNKPLRLKPREFELLHYFMLNLGKATTRDHLLSEVWGWNFSGNSRTVDVHVRWLRQKIELDPDNPQRLVTVRGVGYRFEG